MSICSDIYITREEAEKRVKSALLGQQERLIDLAIKSMDDSDLASELHSDMYYVNIEKTKGRKK